jgi:carboxypeptidase Taq
VVKPSKIRIEADEVTYDLHIVIRFLIERDLFAEKIQVSELPQVWNQMYREHLGVRVENDAEGVMQDTHWPSGFYGYFPSYTLGNIYSGQMLEKLSQDLGEWRSQLAKGNMKDMKRWLIDNVHSQGNLYDPADLIDKITGRKLDAEPYLEYLREKNGALYGF